MDIRGLVLLWWFIPHSSSGSRDIVEAKFTRKGVEKAISVIASTRPRSKIECSKDCLSTAGCVSFTFNETACYLQADDNGKFDIATCYPSSGYEPRTLTGKNYLLRFGDSPVIGDVARMCCEEDGAHLITIESQAMLDDVATLLRALGQDKAEMWTDGRDVYGNDTRFSWSGSELTFISWAGLEPDEGSEDCMFVLYSGKYSMYRFGDGKCAYNERVFMCQK